MKRLLPLALVFLFSCSKQETSTDANQPPSTTSVPNDRKPVTLTSEQIEKVAWAIFMKLHNSNISAPEVTAYVEEFNATGDYVEFKLVRHNGSHAGWNKIEQEEDSEPVEESAEEEDDEDEVTADDAGVSEETEDENAGRYGERYGEGEKEWQFVEEFDTLTYKGSYATYLESGQPESPVKTVRVVFKDLLHHENWYPPSEMTDYVEKSPQISYLDDILVELGTPIVVDGDQLYLKAKVADLTEQDLAGMKKDELGYLRNEIFARHGHTFKTDKMVKYFGNKDWYHSLIDDAVVLLNKFEKRNAEFIKKKEG